MHFSLEMAKVAHLTDDNGHDHPDSTNHDGRDLDRLQGVVVPIVDVAGGHLHHQPAARVGRAQPTPIHQTEAVFSYDIAGHFGIFFSRSENTRQTGYTVLRGITNKPVSYTHLTLPTKA